METSCKPSDYRLTYWNVMWEAEQIRLMFAIREIQYEDIRLELKLGPDDWPIASQLFDQIPEEVQQKLTCANLPLLEVEGKAISGARAVANFLAKRLGFLSNDEWEQAKIDEVLTASQDFSDSFHSIQLASTTEDKEKATKHVVAVVTPKYTKLLNKIIQENSNSSGFMVGDHLTLADLHVMNLVTLPDGRPHPIITDDVPFLRDWASKIAAITQVKKWVETRPKSPF